MPLFELVEVGEKDLAALLEIYRRCEDFLALGPQPRASAAMVLADLAHSRENGGVFYAISVAGQWRGVLDLTESGWPGSPGTEPDSPKTENATSAEEYASSPAEPTQPLAGPVPPRAGYTPPGAGYISLLMIAGEARGQGLGSQVVAAIEQRLRRQGVRLLEADVQVNNPDGMRFWQARGFQVCSAPALQPDGTTSVHLRKEIT